MLLDFFSLSCHISFSAHTYSDQRCHPSIPSLQFYLGPASMLHHSPGSLLPWLTRSCCNNFASWLLYFISVIEFNAMRTRTTSALPIPVCAALNLAVGPQGAFLKIHVCPERKDYGAVLCLIAITTQREHPFVGQGTKEAKTKKHCHLPWEFCGLGRSSLQAWRVET